MFRSDRVRQEERLRGAVLAGDQAAWRALYDGAFVELWSYVLWRCAGLKDVAEEIVQETWLIAVRRIGDFDPAQAPFLAWLRGIAANQLRNHFRAARRHPEAQVDFVEPSRDDREQREQAELIARSLAELPERSEAVLRAKYLDLMSVEQIAAEWDETPKAIESLLTRARQAFRVAYEKLAGIDVAFKERAAMSDAPLPDPLERFLQQPPGAQPSSELREALLRQTSARLRKSRWRRWPIAVGAAAAILAAAYVGLRWSEIEPQPLPVIVENKPAPEPPPLVAAAPVHPLVLENNAFDTEDDRQRVRLYFQAGDLYFEQNQDIESALRCYHQALAYCDARDLELDVNDNYLVMSLKRERRREQ